MEDRGPLDSTLLSSSTSDFVQSTGSHRATISVQPDTSKNDLIFHMEPAAIITGKIVDSEGDYCRQSGSE
jgi:hypothetical protein